MAAEYFGTCQICGRQQKAHPHALAKHGYTIRFGWQMGECFGSGAKPYEISNDRILSAIDAAHAYIARTNERIAVLAAHPFNEDGTVWANYSEQRFGEMRGGSVTLSLEGGRVVAKAYGGKTVHLSTNNFKTVEEAARYLAARQIAEMQGSIRETESAIPYMQARYDNWTPGALVPVTPADRAANAPKIHFEAKKYGSTTGVCVSSANAASAYKRTSTERSEVTCVACLKELARLDDLPRLRAEQAEKERQRAIKAAQRDIKEYTKLIKKGGSDTDVLYWAKQLTEETALLETLVAAAPTPVAE